MNDFIATLLQAVLVAAVPVCAAFIGKGLKALGAYLGQKSENETAKKLYDGLKRIVRRQSVKTVNGYFICKKAYENRESYRFCTIDIKSPEEYDLKVE